MIVTHSDFHSNQFSGLRHTPSRKSPLLWVIFVMPRVTPLYYHYSNEPSICDAFDNTHVQYINDTLHIIWSVFKTPIYTLYQICKICVSFAVQYIYILQTFGMSVEMKLSTEMCAVGSQRIRLNDTVPMSALNECWSKCLTNFLESTYIFSGYFDTSVGVKLSTKICVVGSQRNHLNETAQMSTYNKC